MKVLFLIAAMLFWNGSSQAQRDDVVRGPHGGKLQEVAGLEVELSIGDRDVALCLYSREDAPLEVKGYSATVDIVSGRNRERIELRPDGSMRLVGDSKDFLRPYSSLTLSVTTPSGSTGRVVF